MGRVAGPRVYEGTASRIRDGRSPETSSSTRGETIVKFITAVVLGAGLLAGCSTSPYSGPNERAPLLQGTAAEFSALIQPATGPAHCETRVSEAGEAGARVHSLVHEGRVGRLIAVTVDDQGSPIRYMDVRGNTSDAFSGDRTTIGLYLPEGYAVAGNRPSGQRLEAVEIPLDEALESPNLGNPGGMMEQVLSRCSVTR